MHRALLAAALGSFLLPSLAAAQAAADTSGPRRGSWGAEVGFGDGTSASLLRFRSPRSAWLLGLTFLGRIEREDTPFDPGGDATEGFIAITARAGVRRWRSVAAPLRPFTGLAVIGSYQEGGGRVWTAGVAGEVGASYFFTPHVSLGAAGELSALYFEDDFGAGRERGAMVRGLVARVMGAVYF